MQSYTIAYLPRSSLTSVSCWSKDSRVVLLAIPTSARGNSSLSLTNTSEGYSAVCGCGGLLVNASDTLELLNGEE